MALRPIHPMALRPISHGAVLRLARINLQWSRPSARFPRRLRPKLCCSIRSSLKLCHLSRATWPAAMATPGMPVYHQKQIESMVRSMIDSPWIANTSTHTTPLFGPSFRDPTFATQLSEPQLQLQPAPARFLASQESLAGVVWVVNVTLFPCRLSLPAGSNRGERISEGIVQMQNIEQQLCEISYRPDRFFMEALRQCFGC